tara:strand:+ start:22667 stop:23926 length:1260 start_codon:yes stop_codon:yes gene_type:complete
MKSRVKKNPEAELGVLGVLISDGDPNSLEVQKAMLSLKSSLFYTPAHKELYNIIRKSYDQEQLFDAASMFGMGLNDDAQDIVVNSITNNFFPVTSLHRHIEELNTFEDLRAQLKIMDKTVKDCDAEPIASVASKIMLDGAQKIGDVRLDKMSYGATLIDIVEERDNGIFKNDASIKCDIKQFEEIRNCGLITVAGASGVGKTFFSLYFMNQIIKNYPEKQFMFFSLEMKRNEILERMEHITNNDANTWLLDGRVFDQPRIDIEYIETVCKIHAMKKPLSVIVVDYIGLVTSSGKYDREDLKIADITQRLAGLAMTLNCVVICLSQVNRDPSKRSEGDRCPYPSDVADSVGSVRSSSLWIGIEKQEPNLFIAKCRKSRHGNNFEAFFDFNEGRFKERPMPYKPKGPQTIEDKINYLKGKK